MEVVSSLSMREGEKVREELMVVRRGSAGIVQRGQLIAREASRWVGDAVAAIGRARKAVVGFDGGGCATAMAGDVSGGSAWLASWWRAGLRWNGRGAACPSATEGERRGKGRRGG